MKRTNKVLALFLAVLILLGSAVGMLSVDNVIKAQGEQTDGIGMLYEFNSNSSVDKMTASNGSVKMEYNAEENAMSVNASTANTVNSTTFMYNFPNVAGTTVEYPVVAMRVKLKNADMALSANANARIGYWINGNESKDSSAVYSNYKATTDWQTVYVDFSNYSVTLNKNNHKHFTETEEALSYRRLDFYLFDYKKTDISVNDVFYVKWIGVFDSVETAYSVSDMVYSTAVNFNEELDLKYYNAQQNKAVIGENKNVTLTETPSTAELSFDTEENALKITPKQTGKDRGFLLDVSKLSISADKYPVMAYKLRLTDSDTGDIRYCYYAGTSTLEYAVAVSSAGDIDSNNPLYTTLNRNQVNTSNYAPLSDSSKHTDWQLMMTDFSDSTNSFGMAANSKYWTEDFGGYWSYVQLALPNYRSGSTYASTYLEPYFVEWVGFFSDMESARDYAAIPPRTMYEFDDEATSKLAVANGDNTEITFNNEEDYITIKSKKNEETAANAFCFTMNVAGENLNSAKYPVLAMRVRLKSEAMSVKSNFTLMGTTEAIGIDKANDPDGKVSGYTNAFLGGGGNYMPTSDWQTVYFNFSNTVNPRYEYYIEGEKASNITTVLINMYKYAFTGYTADDVFDVKWVGFFEDEAAALAATGEELPKPIDNVIEFENIRNSAYITTGTNTSLKYNSEEKAISISPKKDNTIDASYISISMSQFGLDSSEYPIAAIMVKTDNVAEFLKSTPVLSTMTVKIAQDKQAGVITGSYITGMARKYKNTSDWQILYFDFSNREYSRSNYFEEGENSSDWSVLAFSAFNYKYEGAKTEDDIAIKWFGVFRSREELDKYAGIERKEGPFFYDFSDPNNLSEAYNVGYDSQLSYDAEEKALKVVAYDMNNDNALATNVAGFSLGEAAGNEIEAICPTEKYPVLAVRVKLKNIESSPGWFYFRSSTGSTDYPISRPKYQEKDGWQTVAVDCSKDSIMTYYFNGNWTGCTLALSVNGLSEAGETFFVKWVGTFKTVEEAFAYTGEKVPVYEEAKPIIEDTAIIEPDDTPKADIVIEEIIPEEETEEILTVEDLMRIKAAAAQVVTMDSEKIYVKQVMTAERFLSAFVTAEGVTLRIANPKGLLLRDETPVYNGYDLIIKKNGVEVMRFKIDAPERETEVVGGVFLDTWQIILICVASAIVLAGITVTAVILIRRRVKKLK